MFYTLSECSVIACHLSRVIVTDIFHFLSIILFQSCSIPESKCSVIACHLSRVIEIDIFHSLSIILFQLCSIPESECHLSRVIETDILPSLFDIYKPVPFIYPDIFQLLFKYFLFLIYKSVPTIEFDIFDSLFIDMFHLYLTPYTVTIFEIQPRSSISNVLLNAHFTRF